MSATNIKILTSTQSSTQSETNFVPLQDEENELPSELINEIILQTSSHSPAIALRLCLINRSISDLIRRVMMRKLWFENHEILASFSNTLKMNNRLGEFVLEIGMIDVFKLGEGSERMGRVSTPDLDHTLPQWKHMVRLERLSLLHPYSE